MVHRIRPPWSVGTVGTFAMPVMASAHFLEGDIDGAMQCAPYADVLTDAFAPSAKLGKLVISTSILTTCTPLSIPSAIISERIRD
jgi:hypothetical protein